jgi:uridine phosphorylase
MENADWRDRIRQIARGWLFSDFPEQQLPPTVILPLENPDSYNPDVFYSRLETIKKYRSVAVGKYQGQAVAVLSSKFGAPAVAMTVECLAMMGVRNIVGVGYCGGLKEDVQSGDLVVPYACVRDDGTSAMYVEVEFPAVADIDLVMRLNSLVRGATQRSHTGVVWSTDAVLMETSERVRYWSSQGCVGVDMESGALFTVARLCGLHAASLLVASDNPLAGRETTFEMLGPATVIAVDASFELAIQLGQ